MTGILYVWRIWICAGCQQDCIWGKYLDQPLSPAEYDQVFEIDDAILAHEFISLMGESIFETVPPLASQPEFSFTGFDVCREEFLSLFKELTEK